MNEQKDERAKNEYGTSVGRTKHAPVLIKTPPLKIITMLSLSQVNPSVVTRNSSLHDSFPPVLHHRLATSANTEKITHFDPPSSAIPGEYILVTQKPKMGVLDLVPFIDWEREAYPKYEDLSVIPLFAVFFPSIRFFLDRFVFEKVGRRLIFGKGKQFLVVETDERRKKIRKFKESAWKCVYFLSAEILALSVSYNEPWFTNTSMFWIGPGDQVWPDQKIKSKLKFHYMYAAGFYTYSIFALVFWETRRKDFGVSMTHHVSSLILILLSYILSFARAGSIVLALHDASDVFLEIGKMSKYSGAETLASFSFVLFVSSWVLLRLIYYPFWVLWSTSYEVLVTLDISKHKETSIYYYVFNSLLYTLLVLNIYWWVLMYRMLVEQILARGQISEDVRSDSEDEDQHED